MRGQAPAQAADLVLRRKPVSYADTAVLLVLMGALAVEWPQVLLFAAVLAAGTAWADTRVVVAGNLVYAANAFRWTAPVDLERLVSVDVSRGAGGFAGPFEPSLAIVDADRHRISVGFWGWRGTADLGRAVLRYAADQRLDERSAPSLERLRRRCR